MTAQSWWTTAEGPQLMQGDLLYECGVPVVLEDFDPYSSDDSQRRVDIQVRDLVVVTQSCDLVNTKLSFVATCSAYTLPEYQEANPGLIRKGMWDEVRKGRIEGLYMLASPIVPEDNSQALVADFREIFSLPLGYLARIAEASSPRHRLRSPYLEHFSQAFARFFMRVGLPSDIRPFR